MDQYREHNENPEVNPENMNPIYTLSEADNQKVEKMKQRIKEFCNKHNIPCLFLMQTQKAETGFMMNGFNRRAGERTSDEMYFVQTIASLMTSDKKEDRLLFGKFYMMYKLFSSGMADNPLALLSAFAKLSDLDLEA